MEFPMQYSHRRVLRVSNNKFSLGVWVFMRELDHTPPYWQNSSLQTLKT